MSSGDYLCREVEKLEEENEQLKHNCSLWEQAAGQTVEQLQQIREDLEHEKMMNACLDSSLGEAKEMLRKCSPYSSGGTDYWVSICNHCDTLKENGHADNCPYIKMIGGV